MRDLSVGNERGIIFRFALPMLIGNVFQQLYTLINSIIVGQFVGKEALAAVGASFPMIFTLISLVIGIAIGATIIISQYFGAKDMRNVLRAIDTLLVFTLLASVVVTITGILISKPIFRLIELPEEVFPLAVSYFNIYMLGLVFAFGFNSIAAILRGMGDSKTPLYFLVISTLLNIGLDLLFVLGFGWGVKGVAWATNISQAVALLFAILYLNRTHDIFKVRWRKPDFDRAILNKSLRIGFPVGFQQAFVALSMLAMYWLVNRFGTDVAAAFSVAFRIDSFASMPAMNFAMALSAFVGQNLGARKPERVKRGLVATFYMTAIISVTISLVGIFFAGPLMRLFTTDAAVVEVGKDYLQIVTGFYIVFSSMFVVGGVMRGAGDTFIPMLITFFALWVVRIPVGYFLSEKMGYHGIWWCIPIAWVVGLGLSFAYYSTGRWRKKVVLLV
ncbi:MAG TPA: MATE family efflux transporter [Bacteroidales bacterium]|nr:MATE family efflux transporter [Bacteroidales bacterium]HPI87481.1 MATE family efflux transporter [Bacteroidales bacterium]HPM92819.1 MATE family efflux transporter [Bacteroidales bacterium]